MMSLLPDESLTHGGKWSGSPVRIVRPLIEVLLNYRGYRLSLSKTLTRIAWWVFRLRSNNRRTTTSTSPCRSIRIARLARREFFSRFPPTPKRNESNNNKKKKTILSDWLSLLSIPWDHLRIQLRPRSPWSITNSRRGPSNRTSSSGTVA